MAQHQSSHEALMLDLLRSEGMMTMEQVAAKLPRLSWGELFLAVDRLSRRGELVIRRQGFDYELRVGAPHRGMESESTPAHPDR
ncbi:MAG: hypothetical protein ACREJU_12305 [Nitrospiraceae bacterium]